MKPTDILAVLLSVWLLFGKPGLPTHTVSPSTPIAPVPANLYGLDASIPAAMVGPDAKADATQLASDSEAYADQIDADAKLAKPRMAYVDDFFDFQKRLIDDTFPGHAGGKYPALSAALKPVFEQVGKTGDALNHAEASARLRAAAYGFQKVK